MSHALRRTSPKGPGQSFIGVCIKCGVEGLTLKQATEECPNVLDMSQGEALMHMVKSLGSKDQPHG